MTIYTNDLDINCASFMIHIQYITKLLSFDLTVHEYPEDLAMQIIDERSVEGTQNP